MTAQDADDPALQRPPGSDLAGPGGAAEARRGEIERCAAQPMVPPPGRADAESERAFGALAERPNLSTWEMLRVFGHDLDLYVAVLPVDSPFAWPRPRTPGPSGPPTPS